MDLKKNYERLFGKMKSSNEEEPFVMTEEQRVKFNNLSSMLAKKYPNAPLTIREGFVYAGYKKLEPVDKFLQRSSLNIQETVRVFSNSGKRGLL